jgi:hypothetical protein
MGPGDPLFVAYEPVQEGLESGPSQIRGAAAAVFAAWNRRMIPVPKINSATIPGKNAAVSRKIRGPRGHRPMQFNQAVLPWH